MRCSIWTVSETRAFILSLKQLFDFLTVLITKVCERYMPHELHKSGWNLKKQEAQKRTGKVSGKCWFKVVSSYLFVTGYLTQDSPKWSKRIELATEKRKNNRGKNTILGQRILGRKRIWWTKNVSISNLNPCHPHRIYSSDRRPRKILTEPAG